jgi:hypothetical protein
MPESTATNAVTYTTPGGTISGALECAGLAAFQWAALTCRERVWQITRRRNAPPQTRAVMKNLANYGL